MFLNIITPCSRPNNLESISKSIVDTIPEGQYRWIVVFDADEVPEDLPANCEAFAIKDPQSRFGNAQRNFAIRLVKDGHVYFNDDDTTLHPDLWGRVQNLTEDFITFSQIRTDGSLRIKGDTVAVSAVDSHNFIVAASIAAKFRWVIDSYAADGMFAKECYDASTSKVFIDQVLSVYNSLR